MDNLVTPGGNPVLDVYGLAFVSATLVGGYPAEGIDLSLNYGTIYNLGGFGIGGYYNPNANGNVSLTPVPDGGSTLALAGISLLGLAALRRRFGV